MTFDEAKAELRKHYGDVRIARRDDLKARPIEISMMIMGARVRYHDMVDTEDDLPWFVRRFCAPGKIRFVEL